MNRPDPPVIVEWYTYQWIPRKRHAIVVAASQAAEWQRQGANMTVHFLDPVLYRECGYKAVKRTF